MPDQDVDGLPNIQAILESLKKAKTAHAAAVRAVSDSNRQVAEFRAMAEPCERQFRDLEQAQAAVAIGCVLGNVESQKTWLDADQAIEGIRRFLRQHEVAMPLYESLAKQQSPSDVAGRASQVIQLEIELDEARSAAKLEAAYAKQGT